MPLKYDLDLPEFYDELLASTINNGCGPAGWKGKLIPDTIYGLHIGEACKVHDFEYHVGLTYVDKINADNRFHRNINRIIAQSKKWPRWLRFTKILNPLRRKRAYIYYTVVREAGEDYFLYGKEGVIV